VAALTVLATVTVSLSPAPPAEADRKKILTIAAKEPDSLDPHGSTIGQSQSISRFLYRGLTKFSVKDGRVTTAEVEPDLAESWTISPDGTQVAFVTAGALWSRTGWYAQKARSSSVMSRGPRWWP
jgi:ABC-type oligopeptide transport system substrate-binding subunit